jgi:DNA-binding transcriptional LysR family regulator
MLSIEDLTFFSVVARSTTLTAAARVLGVTSSAVSQRLRELELKLKVRLADRSTRHLNLTSEGKLLAERGNTVLADVGQIVDSIGARQRTVSGHLRVVAPLGFGRRFIAPIVARFRNLHPLATAELILSENPLRVSTESWDVMIHIGSLRESRLIAMRLAPNGRVLCASPEYIRRRGTPSRPEELARHDCIALVENDEDVTLWRFTKLGSEPQSVRIASAMRSNSGEVVHDWGLAGLGIIMRSEWDLKDDLESGLLVMLLADWELPAADILAIVGPRSGRTARTKQFMLLLESALADPPWRALKRARTPPFKSV